MRINSGRALVGALAACVILSCASVRALDAGSATLKQVDFRAVPLQDALRLLAEQTGLNLVASSEAGKVPVSLFLRQVSAQNAIQELCKSHNLWFKQDTDSGIYRIMTVAEFQRDLVGFREEKTEVFTLLYPNSVDVANSLQDLFGDRIQLSLGQEDNGRDLEARFQRFDIVDQRSQGLGLFSGGLNSSNFSGPGFNRNYNSNDNGYGNNNNINNRTSLLRRTDSNNYLRERNEESKPLTPEQAQAIQKGLNADAGTAEYDAAIKALKGRQASIYVSVNQRNNLLLVRTSDLQAMEEIGKLVKRLDVPTPLVLLEVKVLSIELSDDFSSMFDYQFSDGVTSAGGFTSGSIQPPASDLLSGVRRQQPITPGGTGVQGNDLTFQFVNNNFRARLQLLQSKNRVTELATPLLMTANNEVSRLFVGEERPIVRNISTQTVVNNNIATTSPNTTIEFRPVGTTLLITPNINSDRTVTLRLLQENSTINAGGATIPVVVNNGFVQNQPVDVVATRTVSGTIVAKDNLTLAVGGLIEEHIQDTRAQVPVLGRIPGLGLLFRRQTTGRTRRELVITIRPHVLSTPAESQDISRELVNKLSLHPNAPFGEGTLNTFGPHEVPRADPPKTMNQDLFRFHSVKVDDF